MIYPLEKGNAATFLVPMQPAALHYSAWDWEAGWAYVRNTTHITSQAASSVFPTLQCHYNFDIPFAILL